MNKNLLIAKQVKREIERQVPEIEVDILKIGEQYILTVTHDKCVCGQYYLSDFLKTTEDIEKIAKLILEEYNSYQIETAILYMQDNIKMLQDYNYAKQHIYMRIENIQLLSEIELPYVMTCSKSAIGIFYLKEIDYNGRIITTALTNDLIHELGWKVTTEDLFHAAKQNITEYDPFIFSLMEDMHDVIRIERKSKKYVDTIILFPELLMQVCNQLKTDIVSVYIPDDKDVFVFKGPEKFQELFPVIRSLQSYNGEHKKGSGIYLFKKNQKKLYEDFKK